MTIQTSSAREVESLLQQLNSHAAVEREAAVARLRVIGVRARDRVLSLVRDMSASPVARAAALGVLETIDDQRTKGVATAAAADPDALVAVAAIQVLRAWLARDDDASVLETISSIVTDDTRRAEVRRAALEALADLPEDLTRPLVERVGPSLAASPPLGSPERAADWLAANEQAPLGILHDLLVHARDQERTAARERERLEWLTVRAGVHAVLARRSSRIALYDARDMLERAVPPLPMDMLVTMKTVGDLHCLDGLAMSWEAVPGDTWWRGQVSLVAAEIIKREKATGRNAIVKRVRARWPGFLG